MGVIRCTVSLFTEQIRVSHTLEGGNEAIFNNTVVNIFRDLSVDYVFEAPPMDVSDGDSLSVDCTGVQGHHQVIWFTDNEAVGNDAGEVNSELMSNSQQVLSNYSSRWDNSID